LGTLDDYAGDAFESRWDHAEEPESEEGTEASPDNPARHAVAIKVEYTHPPIPIREFDWCAYRDGYEPGNLMGHGKTKEAAIANLIAQEEDR